MTLATANYALFDGLVSPDALVSLYRRDEPLDIEPLYLTTRWKELHPKGPILVGLRGHSSLLDEIRDNTCTPGGASLLSSSAPLRALAEHLRRMVAPADVFGGQGLLRFADPLVTRYWLGSYQGAHLDNLLGPIDAWHAPETLHSWEPATPLQWSTFSRAAPPAPWQDSHAVLGQAQLAALELATRWRYMERLYRSLAQRSPEFLHRIAPQQLTHWFHQRIDEAQDWGLSCERGLAIWVEYSLRWGEGFALPGNTDPDSPYRRWLARSPTALQLSPKQRIEQMDDDCLPRESNQESA